jgi:hypothetical protein
VIGHYAASTGIGPFTALVIKVMTREPYASAKRVFWIVDNGPPTGAGPPPPGSVTRSPKRS